MSSQSCCTGKSVSTPSPLLVPPQWNLAGHTLLSSPGMSPRGCGLLCHIMDCGFTLLVSSLHCYLPFPVLASPLQLDHKLLEGRIRSSMSTDPLECLQCEAPRECSDYCCFSWQVLHNKLPMPTKNQDWTHRYPRNNSWLCEAALSRH